MLNFFSKRLNNKKGFTLIELIVVIAILAILALIAIPRMGKFRSDAALSTHNANVRTLESAATMYLAEHGTPSSEVSWPNSSEGDEKKETNYIADWPDIPVGVTGISESEYAAGYEVKIKPNGKVEVTPGQKEKATN